jgi:hypothetical protein
VRLVSKTKNQLPIIFSQGFPFLMKIKHALYPLSIFTILVFGMACENKKSDSADTIKAAEVVAAKAIRAISYRDNGAVVPFPNVRQVTVVVEDSSKIFMNYATIKAGKDSTDQKITVEDAARREEIYDKILELAELPDGIDIKPGKQPCVGSRSIDISVFFNNGDTSRFSIMGGARCDKTLCPPFWAIDSLADILIKN